MGLKKTEITCFLWMLALAALSCSPKIKSSSSAGAFISETGIPDYSNLAYWAAHPRKKDFSDTVPLPLIGVAKEKTVDVFFLHPTTFTETDALGTNANIDDSAINNKTDQTSILYQASAFNERARIFAPRYRQAHIRMYNAADSSKRNEAFELAYKDVRNAFQYYLEVENKGRPIVIASHSQGTTHATRLIKEFFDNETLRNQLVCAYLLGIGVKKTSYKTIPVCEEEAQVGCFVSWRTFRDDYADGWASRLDTTIAVVNPLSWKTNNELVGKEEHKGAILYNMNKIYKETHNAQAVGSGLWISRPRFPGSFLYRSKNYHAGDINLFYMNIRDDLSAKIDRYDKIGRLATQ